MQVTSLPDFWLKLTNFYICGYANVELILSFPVSFTSLINCWTKSEYYYIRFQEIFAVLVSVVSTRNKWSWYVSQTNGLGTSLKQHLKTHFGEFLTFLLWYIKVVCSFFGNHKSDVIHVLKCVWQDVLIGSKIWCFYVGSIIMGLKRNIYVEWECKIDMYGMWNITMFIHKFLEHTGVE